MNSFSALINKIQSSKSTDFGDLFNMSVTVFKKVWIQGLILQLLSILTMLPLIIIFYIPYFNLVKENTVNGILDSAAVSQSLINDYGASLIGVYLMLLVVSVLSYLMYLGFYNLIKQIDHGESFVISDLFCFFKSSLIGKSLGVFLAYVGISLGAALLCFLPLVYAVVPLMFLMPVFAYNPNLSITELVKLSFAIGNKKWGITFSTLVLNGILLYVISLVSFGLGSLFFGCFLYLPQYIIYKEAVGFERSKSEPQTIDL